MTPSAAGSELESGCATPISREASMRNHSSAHEQGHGHGNKRSVVAPEARHDVAVGSLVFSTLPYVIAAGGTVRNV